MSHHTLKGKSILITGGGSGIGLGTAELLIADGAHVTICGRTETKLEAAVSQILAKANHGGTVQHLVADVTVEADVERAVTAAVSRTGTLDGLFACAGGSLAMGPMLDADLEGWRGTLELNVLGSFLCVKHGGKAMAEHGGGSMVLMSSGAGHFPHRFLSAYGISKAAIDELVHYAAEELGDRGIRVNSVRPGIIDDELMSFITAGGALLDDYLAEMPLSRVGTVDDVARIVRFLLSDESAWMTGERIGIDGGHHTRRGANYQKLFG